MDLPHKETGGLLVLSTKVFLLVCFGAVNEDGKKLLVTVMSSFESSLEIQTMGCQIFAFMAATGVYIYVAMVGEIETLGCH